MSDSNHLLSVLGTTGEMPPRPVIEHERGRGEGDRVKNERFKVRDAIPHRGFAAIQTKRQLLYAKPKLQAGKDSRIELIEVREVARVEPPQHFPLGEKILLHDRRILLAGPRGHGKIPDTERRCHLAGQGLAAPRSGLPRVQRRLPSWQSRRGSWPGSSFA